MLFEAYQAGAYSVTRRALRLTAFRSSTSRRDPDFPEEDYVNRPERVKDPEFRWDITESDKASVLTLTDADRQSINYTRILSDVRG